MGRRTLGYLIRDKRKDMGLTQADLADDIGVSDSYIAKIETDSQVPSVKKLNEIAEILQIPKEKIFDYSAKTRPLISPLNRVKEYDKRWAKLSLEMKNALLEFAPFIEKYL